MRTRSVVSFPSRPTPDRVPARAGLHGRVADPRAVAAWIQGGLAMRSWLVVASQLGLTVIVPTLAVDEVSTRPRPRRITARGCAHVRIYTLPTEADVATAVEKIVTDD